MLGRGGALLGRVGDRGPHGKRLLVAIENLGGVRLGAALGSALAMLHTNVANDGFEMGEDEARVVGAFGAAGGELASSGSEKVADLHV